MDTPKVTIVTPSLNQAAYLEDTLQSVLGQGYKDLDYVVMDGGSDDESVAILRRHEKGLSWWVSEPDAGQADAINRAFEKASGDVFAFIASDDYYLPGTLRFVADHIDVSRPQLLFGNCIHVFEGTGRAFGSDVVTRHNQSQLRLHDYVIQPASFMTRKAWDATGPLDTSLHFAFDWDWFIRAEVAGVNFVPVDRMMSVYRWHPHHKTGTGGTRRLDELEGIYRRYAGERYADLFRHLQPKRVRKGLYRALATRLHPLATETSLVRCAFPIRARNFTNREILDVMSMGIE